MSILSWTTGTRDAVCADVPVVEGLETRLLLDAFPLVGGKFSYTDNNGCVVTVSLSGGGSGEVNFPGAVASGTPDSIFITPANAKSTLTIEIKGVNGIKTTTIGDLIIDDDGGFGLKTIKAPNVTLAGTLTMNASDGATITLGDLANDATLTLTGFSSSVTNLTLGHVGAGSDIQAANLPLAVTAQSFRQDAGTGVSLAAFYFTKIDVRGDMESCTITAAGMDAKGVSIDKMTVKGIFDGVLTVAGRVNNITANEARGAIAAGSFGTLTIKGDLSANVTAGMDAKGLSIDHLNVEGLLRGNVTAAGRINKLTAASAEGSAVAAFTFGEIKIKKDADLCDFMAAGMDAKGVSIDHLNVGGKLRANVGAAGRINKITADAMENCVVSALTFGEIKVKKNVELCVFTAAGMDTKGVSLDKMTVDGVYDAALAVPGRVNNITMAVARGAIGAGSFGTIHTKGEMNAAVTVAAVNGMSIDHLNVNGVLRGNVTATGRINKLTTAYLEGSTVSALTFGTIHVKKDAELCTVTATGIDAQGVSIHEVSVNGEFNGSLTAAGRVNKLTTTEARGTIRAGSFNNITIKRGLFANITVTGADARGVSIDHLNVGGIFAFNIVTASGRINKLTAAAMEGCTVTAFTFGTIEVKRDMGFYNQTNINATGKDANGVAIDTIKVNRSSYSYAYITASGRINTISVGEMWGGVSATSLGTLTAHKAAYIDMSLTGTDAKGVSLGALKVSEYYVGAINVAGRINEIAAGSIDAGSIRASSIGTLTVKGYWGSRGNLYTTLNVTGTVDTIKIPGTASLSPASSKGSLRIAGGGKIIAKNGTFLISGAEVLYIL
ncbi:MAG: hypothetical protein FWE88_04765 [Phycisphaerae bacterium]|nr:hypothetical protein [Phycisphaerae bacterium]